jgi:hypothetical protein
MGIGTQMALALSHCQTKFCLLGTEPFPNSTLPPALALALTLALTLAPTLPLARH